MQMFFSKDGWDTRWTVFRLLAIATNRQSNFRESIQLTLVFNGITQLRTTMDKFVNKESANRVISSWACCQGKQGQTSSPETKDRSTTTKGRSNQVDIFVFHLKNTLNRPPLTNLLANTTATLTTLPRQLFYSQAWWLSKKFPSGDSKWWQRYKGILTRITTKIPNIHCEKGDLTCHTMINLGIYIRCHPIRNVEISCICEQKTPIQRSRFHLHGYILYRWPHPANRKWAPFWEKWWSGASVDLGISTYFTVSTALLLRDDAKCENLYLYRKHWSIVLQHTFPVEPSFGKKQHRWWGTDIDFEYAPTWVVTYFATSPSLRLNHDSDGEMFRNLR